MFYVYLLQSKSKNQIYLGSTKDLRKRVSEHNKGKEISTKRYIPWKVIYYEAFEIEKYARDREMKLKYNGNAMKELKKRIGLDNLSPFHIKLKTGLGYPVPIQNKSKIGLGYPVPIQNKSKIGLGLPSTSSKNAKTGAGFTLIELLVVIAIIGVLAGSLLILLNPVAQMQKSRDGKRKSEMKQIQTGLELYRADQGSYPAASGNAVPNPLSSGSITYLSIVPKDPKGQAYYYAPSGNGYAIYSCAEHPAAGDPDVLTSVPSGVSSRFTGCTSYYRFANP